MVIELDERTTLPLRQEAQSAKFLRVLYVQSRALIISISLALLVVVAVADYLTGVELSFSIFYLVSISLPTWFVSRKAGFVISIISVACSLAGDLAAGARYSSHFVPWWNVLITLSFYLAMVTALSSLRSLHQQLEARVRERTAALRSEISERVRLERALLAVSEREQRRIGHDLHDSICQHLLGSALAGQVLCDKLNAMSLPEAGDAAHLVTLVEEGIELARSLARGLAPVQIEAEGLMAAFRECARTTTNHFGIECHFQAPQPVLISDTEVAMNLFRIAQEAVSNAIKHGRAQRIVISLVEGDGTVELIVSDDGCGLPDPPPDTRGMGLHIMKHRAAMIAASFEATGSSAGTTVRCRMTNHTEADQPR